MSHVDGNAIVGALSLAMGTDVAGATGVCAECGHDHPFAEARVYLRCPGMVMRCPSCSAAEIVLIEIDHQLLLTIRGLATIRLSRPRDATRSHS